MPCRGSSCHIHRRGTYCKMPGRLSRHCEYILFLMATLAAGCQRGNMTASNSAVNERICDSHFRKIAIALQMYHSMHGRYPPPHLVDSKGTPTHSWRALILPFTDHSEQFRGYKFNEAW